MSSPRPSAAGPAPASPPVAAASSPASPADAVVPPTGASPRSRTSSPRDPDALLPPTHWAEAAEDAVDDDTDSAIGTDTGSSTTSLSSSILEYRMIHGRSYHSDQGNAYYWAANDDKCNETLDISHHFQMVLLDNKLFLAPLEKGKIQKVLDIGTGTGVWALDFADEFPEAAVVGTDISPIQRTWVPPNLQFEIEDCTQNWTFDSNVFDFVHIRYLIGCIPDWDALMRNAYAVCKPGGWIESIEGGPFLQSDDGSVAEGSAMDEWGKFFAGASRAIGNSFNVVRENLQRPAIERAGFVDVHVRDIKVPFGGWSSDPVLKQVGQLSCMTFDDSEGFVMRLATTLYGWTDTEVKVYCALVRRQMRDPKTHAYIVQRFVWARKPELSTA